MPAVVTAALYELELERWVREHSPTLTMVAIVLLALVVVRLIVTQVTRLVALALLGALALFVVTERHDIQQCTSTCQCELAGRDVEVPLCTGRDGT